MDDALRRAAESQMRRRAPDGDDAVDVDRASKRARETTTTASSPTETPALGRFAYGALRTFLDVSTFRGAVFATCSRAASMIFWGIVSIIIDCPKFTLGLLKYFSKFIFSFNCILILR